MFRSTTSHRALAPNGSGIRDRLFGFAADTSGNMSYLAIVGSLVMMVFGGVGVDMMHAELKRTKVQNTLDRAVLAAGATPYQRLNIMVGKLNRAMQRNPLLTEAMTRAFVFADASAAGEVDHVGKLMDSMFARAMSDGEPTEDQYHIARVISDVWLSNLLAWLTRRASATDVAKRLDLAVRLLIGDGDQPKN